MAKLKENKAKQEGKEYSISQSMTENEKIIG